MPEVRRPFVTVIIPALNAQESLPFLLDSLQDQSYPADRRELIVVDNGSTDRTVAIARERGVSLLVEDQVKGPGAARNRGIVAARGEILAFLDADCIATPTWIDEGVKFLVENGADIVAGRVDWIFSVQPSAAEVFDSLVHLRNDVHVEKDRTAATANMFVADRVFRRAGLFPPFRYGEDTLFVLRAQAAGFRLAYARTAVIRHPARGFWGVMAKAIRVGWQFDAVSRAMGRHRNHAILTCARAALPRTPWGVRKLIRMRGSPNMEHMVWRLCMVWSAYGYAWGMTSTVSLIRGFFCRR